MSDPRFDVPANGERVYFSIFHAFIDDDLDSLAQDVYDALGALDAAAPEAIKTFRGNDLCEAVDAAERWSRSDECTPEERETLRGSVRRLRRIVRRGSE
jgi:hypothetical protein